MTQPINKKSPELAPQQSEPHKQDCTWYRTVVKVVSGGMGGAAGIYLATPLIYAKMILQEKARNPQQPPKWHKNPTQWFSGGGGLAAWMFPQTATAFCLTEWMRQKLSENGKRELSTAEKIACSAATGGVLTLFVNPQELIFTQQKKAEGVRLQWIEQKKLDPKSVPSKNATQIAVEIWEKQGVKGFFRAFPETAGREVVSNVVLTYFAAEYPILAPVLGATISQPLDGRKTHKQADFLYKAPIREMLKANAFAGLLPRIAIYLVFMNAAPRVKNRCEQWMLPEAN